MNEVAINEPLRRVYVLFEEGKIRPMAIEWGRQASQKVKISQGNSQETSRQIRVVRVNSSWVDRSLRPHRHGFSLTMETGEIFQVSYEEGNPVWRLEYVLTDG